METTETKRDRFKRLAEKRTNAVIKALDILGHCGNKHSYVYSKEEVDRILHAIEKKLNDVKQQFSDAADAEGFKL